jgi:hypothetical protein
MCVRLLVRQNGLFDHGTRERNWRSHLIPRARSVRMINVPQRERFREFKQTVLEPPVPNRLLPLSTETTLLVRVLSLNVQNVEGLLKLVGHFHAPIVARLQLAV